MDIHSVNIITGYYGSGKTTFAVHLALQAAEQGRKTTIIDLDTVNPYFRTHDFAPLFAQKGIRLIAPVFAGTNLDLPALTGQVNTALGDAGQTVIIDVGGDDAGATPLGAYRSLILDRDWQMLHLVNFCRMETETPQEALSVLRSVEVACRLPATGLVGNSNLGALTTREDVEASIPLLEQMAEMTKLPIAGVCMQAPASARLPYPVLPLQLFERGATSNVYESTQN